MAASGPVEPTQTDGGIAASRLRSSGCTGLGRLHAWRTLARFGGTTRAGTAKDLALQSGHWERNEWHVDLTPDGRVVLIVEFANGSLRDD